MNILPLKCSFARVETKRRWEKLWHNIAKLEEIPPYRDGLVKGAD